jgi:5-methylcytosine-specific restriction enzyme A
MTLLRPCLEPGCPELVGRGRCAAHTAAYKRRHHGDPARGYGSAQHQAWRRAVIQRDRECVDCGAALLDARGEPLSTADADHVVALQEGGSYALGNGAGRCHGCHSRKTARELRAATFGDIGEPRRAPSPPRPRGGRARAPDAPPGGWYA